MSITRNVPRSSSSEDPYKNYNFIVEIDGMLAAGYSEVNGIGSEIEVERRTFGGDNSMEYKFLKQAKYSDLVLKKGISDDGSMWEWYEDTVQGNITPKNGTIYLYDPGKTKMKSWDFFHAYPIKWEGPGLNGQGNEVATHTLTLTYRQLKKGQDS